MKRVKEVFNTIITDISQVREVYRWLGTHYGDDTIIVAYTTRNGIHHHEEQVKDSYTAHKVYSYLLNNWRKGKVKLRVLEQAK